MFSIKVKPAAMGLTFGMAVALTALAASPAIAATGTPQTAASHMVQTAPDTGTGCTGFTDEECTTVTGTGLLIGTVSGQFTESTLNGPYTGHIEIHGPKGHIKDCATFHIDGGQKSPTCTWTANHLEPAGNYCTTAWTQTKPGSYRNDGDACVDVHK